MVAIVVGFGLFFLSDFGHVLHSLYCYVLFIDRLLTADQPPNYYAPSANMEKPSPGNLLLLFLVGFYLLILDVLYISLVYTCFILIVLTGCKDVI